MTGHGQYGAQTASPFAALGMAQPTVEPAPKPDSLQTVLAQAHEQLAKVVAQVAAVEAALIGPRPEAEGCEVGAQRAGTPVLETSCLIRNQAMYLSKSLEDLLERLG